MNTSEIKKFAIAARKKLIQGVINKISTLGFNAQGEVTLEQMPVLAYNDTNFNGRIIPSTNFYHQWMSLHDAIQEKGVKNIYEEVAYTWFNRLVAIRILQKQEQSLITNVLDFVDDSRTPSIVNDARHGIFPDGIDEKTMTELNNLLCDDTKTTEQFAILITSFCHATPMINKIFGRVNDYTELLLPNDILAAGGFVDMLNNSPYITDDDYKQTELIGWLYQFYISERKDEVFDLGEWSAEDIPAGTQIFTPNWVVKYMVENTLGRIYLDNHPDASFKDDLKYLVEPSEGEHPVFEYESLENLRCADFSCGSGHILGEFFDLLYRLYEEEWYDGREAIEHIFKHNLAGIDLDTRAMQLSTFALMLKACQKDESFKNAECMPQVLDMPSINFNTVCGTVNTLFEGYNSNICKEITDAFRLVENADELGSIMKFNLCDASREAMTAIVADYRKQDCANAEIVKALDLMLMLTDKYSAIAMNPPYMGSKHMDATLKNYVKKNYLNTKTDLFAVFMDVAIDRLADRAKYGMINMQNWMFLVSYNNLRHTMIDEQVFDSMLHLGPNLFDELAGEVVQSTTFIISKNAPNNNSCGTYYRLVDGISCSDKEKLFFEQHNKSINVLQNIFERIPGSPIIYWVSNTLVASFENNKLGNILPVKKGMDTGDNDYYLRMWYEPSVKNVGYYKSQEGFLNESYTWVPYNKGGKPQRRWYGNNNNVLLWANDGEELRNTTANLRSKHLYFKNAITWNALATDKTTARLSDYGALFDSAGSSMFPNSLQSKYVLGLMNSKCINSLLYILNPTMNFGAGSVGSLPYIYENNSIIEDLVEKCIEIAKEDWNSNETSWDFNENELIRIYKANGCSYTLEQTLNAFIEVWTEKFYELHRNEEELNEQFINIYGLQNELTKNVPLNEVTILQQKEKDIENGQLKWYKDIIIKQLISYAMGCWMGRYRLDRPGLHIAHPNPTEQELQPYSINGKTFDIDDDGIVPLMDDDAPFPDNAEKLMKEFVEVVFGSDNKARNLDFINATLGRNTNIAKYLKTDFWKEHLTRYQKRPIYWLFQSSRKNPAFQVLVYMHRMDAYTCEKVRTKYLLVYIEHLKNRILYLQGQPTTTAVTRELTLHEAALKECLEYEERLHDIANQQIAFDLDDGVKVNYAKFGDVLAAI